MPRYRSLPALIGLTVVSAVGAAQQPTLDPFPTPIETTQGVVAVNFVEFATIPDVKGEAPRLMHLVDEPGTRRIFVSVMTGQLYSISYDGKVVTPYLDVNAPSWSVSVQSDGFERGVQSFAFHPQFAQQGTPGYGRFYTYTDTSNVTPKADFVTPGPKRTHDTVLLEWTAKTPTAASYDGGAPRELFRAAQPFGNHNGGQIGFDPLAKPGTPEFGLLYVGLADGGSGGDPLNVAQNMSSAFGKILRIDPLGTNSANGRYGIPASNPFVKDAKPDTVAEIYALGVRNPQRFSWDTKDGRLYVADIGQNAVEEISPVTSGANLGWNKWEASFPYVNGQVDAVKAARRAWPDVAGRRIRSPGSALSARRDHRRVHLPRHRDSSTPASDDLRRQPERSDLLRRRRQVAERWPGSHPPGAVQRQGHAKDAPPAHSGAEHEAGQRAGGARRPAVRAGPAGTDLRAQQARRRHPPVRARRALIAVRFRSAAGCRAPAGWRETR